MGGRKKGTPNKDVGPLEERCRALGVDPFEILLLFAKGDWEKLGYETNCIGPDLRMGAAKEASQYIHAKRKAIEVSGHLEVENPLDEVSDEELDAILGHRQP